MLLDSTLPRSQYDYALPQVSFTAVGYHKHITLVFNPTVRGRGSSVKPWGWREKENSHTLRPRYWVEGGMLCKGPSVWGPSSILDFALRTS